MFPLIQNKREVIGSQIGPSSVRKRFDGAHRIGAGVMRAAEPLH